MSDRSTPQQRPVEELSRYLTEVTGEPVDELLLTRALTHRSFSYENGSLPHNERLEFLGDSVLGLVVTDHLHETHPDVSEGELATLLAPLVKMREMARVARTIDLGSFVHLGRDKNSILADTVEAVIGAVYLSAPKPVGLAAAARLVHALLGTVMVSSARLGAGLDWKTSLQEVAAGQGRGSPHYRTSDEGPDHDKTFTAEAVIDDEVVGAGVGRTKKDAEQQAAERAYTALAADEPATAD